MKTLKTIIALAALVALAGCCGGCNIPDPAPSTYDTSGVTNAIKMVFGGSGFHAFDFEGHRYISVYSGGITHAESCKCKEAK